MPTATKTSGGATLEALPDCPACQREPRQHRGERGHPFTRAEWREQRLAGRAHLGTAGHRYWSGLDRKTQATVLQSVEVR